MPDARRPARASTLRLRIGTFVAACLVSAAIFLVTAYALTNTSDPATYRLPAHPPAGPVAFVALGDSLGAGLCAPRGKGFLALIARDLEKARPGSTFENEARPGYTIADVVRELKRHPPSRADAVVIEIGANDVERQTSPVTFQEQYRELFATLHERYPSAPVVVMGVPDIGARSALVAPPLKPVYGLATAWYDEIARRIADDHGAGFFDFYALSHTPAATAPENVCPDGIHATTSGHARLAEALEPPMRDRFRF